MIERNLGNVERILRLLLGIGLGLWVFMQPDRNGMDLFITAIAVFLILNGVFARCYLWFVLDVNTARSDDKSGTTAC
ncbi:MAG: DUF2892 domain-containing protein [Halioglobus sp.]|nr:DUF2892 domain-containing protein [Halioglobus sp.]